MVIDDSMIHANDVQPRQSLKDFEIRQRWPKLDDTFRFVLNGHSTQSCPRAISFSWVEKVTDTLCSSLEHKQYWNRQRFLDKPSEMETSMENGWALLEEGERGRKRESVGTCSWQPEPLATVSAISLSGSQGSQGNSWKVSRSARDESSPVRRIGRCEREPHSAGRCVAPSCFCTSPTYLAASRLESRISNLEFSTTNASQSPYPSVRIRTGNRSGGSVARESVSRV